MSNCSPSQGGLDGSVLVVGRWGGRSGYCWGMKFALLVGGGEVGAAVFEEFVRACGSTARVAGARRLGREGVEVRRREGSVVRSTVPAGADDSIAAFVVVEVEGEGRADELAASAAERFGCAVEVRPVMAPGDGSTEKAGVAAYRVVDGVSEFAFVIKVADERRPWPGSEAFDELMANCGRVLSKLEDSGRFRGTERLAPASRARTARGTVGTGPRIVDGPFSEARELIGGFILGECGSLDEALALAEEIPGAVTGVVEVREVLG